MKKRNQNGNGKSVIIIGTGLGGLATALRLSAKGYKVTMMEKNDKAGGRLHQLKMGDYTFDMGPSFFSMSYEFDELFDSCGMDNPLEYQQLDPLYEVSFAGNGRKYKVSTDLDKLSEEFETIEPDFRMKLDKYLKGAGEIFHDTEYRIVKKNFKNKLDYVFGMSKVPLKHTSAMTRSMWKELDQHFDSHELKVIFSLVGFFLGATPFNTPAVYKLLNYTELVHDGYWNVKGGMYRITEVLVDELLKRGVEIVYNTEIKNVIEHNSHVIGVVDTKGKEWKSDIVVCNADAAAFRGKVLGRKKYREEKLDKMHWTLSPFTIYLGVKGKIDGLTHHNYFLGKNFKEYADTIFKTSLSPERPYYYVNVSSKSNPDCAPENGENLFILCPMPDLRFKKDWSDSEQLANNIIEDLGQRVGYDIQSNIEVKKIMNPEEWESKFNLYRGSGLGLAHGLNQVGGFRPSNKDEKLDNLFYVGASTVPGTGLPIVIISSKLVTDRIENEYKPVS